MPPCCSVSLTPLFLDRCHFCGTEWVRGDIPVLLLALGEKLCFVPVKDDVSRDFSTAGLYYVGVGSLSTSLVEGFWIAIIFKSCKASH